MICKSCNGTGYHVVPDEHDDPIQTPCLECASETWRIFHSAAYEKVSDLTANLAAAQSRIAELEAEVNRLTAIEHSFCASHRNTVYGECQACRAFLHKESAWTASGEGNQLIAEIDRWRAEALAARDLLTGYPPTWKANIHAPPPAHPAYAAARAANEKEG